MTSSADKIDVSRRIQLTRGLFAIVDECDFELVSQYKWCAVPSSIGTTFYASTSIQVDGKRTCLRMHRLLLNAPREMLVDHKDGNGLNNRRSNIRICTTAQNNMNQRKHVVRTSRYKGVCWNNGPGRKPWIVMLNIDGKQRTIGRFQDEREAALAYNAAALKYYGEFANINELSP